MNTKALSTCLASSVLIALFACSEKPAEPAAEPGIPAAPPAAPAAPPSEPAAAPALPAVPAGAKVWFVEPADGAKVTGPAEGGKISVAVKMGAEGIAVKPAGQIEAGSGHHHILVDTTPDPVGTVVAQDNQHLHFGKAQTEATLSLTPGEHTLQLQLADGIHRSYGPSLASTIKINVAEGPASAAAAKAAPAAPATRETHKH
jgi:hypothetical protein